MFRLISVDLDETVWPCKSVIDAAEQALCAWLSETAPRVIEAHDAGTMREHRRELMHRQPGIAHDVSAVRRASLGDLLGEFGYSRTLANEAMAVFMAHRNRIEPFADAVPGLRALRRRHRLVSVTNGNSDPEQTPLRGIFHHSLTAADAGAAKPAPDLFEMAMALADATPAESLHVGDDPRMDVEAARRTGLTAIWVNRAGIPWPVELPPPAAELTDLIQLETWIAVRQR
ncbi:MAG: HAD-IA family hydrolase [Pseudomonadota bacterium]|nr:HAD-IA family hydrolase [Pseudomonadota bacterium]